MNIQIISMELIKDYMGTMIIVSIVSLKNLISHPISPQCPNTESTNLNYVSLRKMGLRMDKGMNGKEKSIEVRSYVSRLTKR